MGTHGRNAITKDGIHICHEQSMDGHDAANDFLDPFLLDCVIPNITHPTMKDQTSECEQEYFAHIDYDTKTLYTSYQDPNGFLKMSDEEILKSFYEKEKNIKNIKKSWQLEVDNLNKIKKLGWTFIFNTYDCSDELDCINSPKNKLWKKMKWK